MSRRPRRNRTQAFKVKVALATLKGEKTLSDLAQLFDVLDMPHIYSGSLIGYFTNKENRHGTQTQRRIQA